MKRQQEFLCCGNKEFVWPLGEQNPFSWVVEGDQSSPQKFHLLTVIHVLELSSAEAWVCPGWKHWGFTHLEPHRKGKPQNPQLPALQVM